MRKTHVCHCDALGLEVLSTEVISEARMNLKVSNVVFLSVGLEFSTNQGRSWSLLHTECLPELCAGPHLPHSTVYSSDNYSGYEDSPVWLFLVLFQSACEVCDDIYT